MRAWRGSWPCHIPAPPLRGPPGPSELSPHSCHAAAERTIPQLSGMGAQLAGSGSREGWAYQTPASAEHEVRIYVKRAEWTRSSVSLTLGTAPVKPLNRASRLGCFRLGLQAPRPLPAHPAGHPHTRRGSPFQGQGRRGGSWRLARGSGARVPDRGPVGRRAAAPAPRPLPSPAAVTVLWRPPLRVPTLRAGALASLAGGCHLAARGLPWQPRKPPLLAR